MAVDNYPRLSVRVPAEGRQRLETTARAMDVSLSEAIRRLLIRGLRQQERQKIYPQLSDDGDGRIRG